MLRRTAPFSLGLAALAIQAAAAQSTLILPASATRAEGSSVDAQLASGIESRTQILISRSVLGPSAKKLLYGISIRRDTGMNTDLGKRGWKGGWIDLEIRASWTPADPKAPSRDFAKNHGKRVFSVYRGLVAVPTSTWSGSGPAPFRSPHALRVPFKIPLPAASSGALCLELVNRRPAPSTGKLPPENWIADLWVQDLGARALSFGKDCFFAGKKSPVGFLATNAQVETSTLAPGASFEAEATGPKGLPALALLGLSNKSFAGIPLPFDLGLLGAPGCKLYVSIDLAVAVPPRSFDRSYPFGEFRLLFPLPNFTSLAGATLYQQWLFLEPRRNRLGLTASDAVLARFGTKPPTLGMSMVQAYAPAASSGTVYLDRTPVLALDLR